MVELRAKHKRLRAKSQELEASGQKLSADSESPEELRAVIGRKVMNCDWTKENVVLFIYGELPDDAKFEFEQHVRHCLGCRRELDAAIEFKDAMAAAPVKEISPSFLAANRMQLQEALEHAEQSRNIFSSFIF